MELSGKMRVQVLDYWRVGELMLTIDEIRRKAEAILANAPERKQQVLHAHLS